MIKILIHVHWHEVVFWGGSQNRKNPSLFFVDINIFIITLSLYICLQINHFVLIHQHSVKPNVLCKKKKD